MHPTNHVHSKPMEVLKFHELYQFIPGINPTRSTKQSFVTKLRLVLLVEVSFEISESVPVVPAAIILPLRVKIYFDCDIAICGITSLKITSYSMLKSTNSINIIQLISVMMRNVSSKVRWVSKAPDARPTHPGPGVQSFTLYSWSTTYFSK